MLLWCVLRLGSATKVGFDCHTKYLQDLCEVDDAMTLLDKDDQERFQQELKQAETAAGQRKEFEASFNSKHKDIKVQLAYPRQGLALASLA